MQGVLLSILCSSCRVKSAKVYLEGEAFFEVSKDVEHPFVVNANQMDVKVLGTKFNLSSYHDDESISTVLVEGSVSLSKAGESSGETALKLEPGYRAVLDKKENTLAIDKVNTDLYTGWMKNKLIFKNMKFKHIRKKLARKYNVEIINLNHELDENTYNATFDVETIEQVLNTLNRNYPIDYVFENNQIKIN